MKRETSPARLTVATRAPSQSIWLFRSSERRDSGICRNEIAMTAAARGTLMKKTQCHDALSMSQPPRTGPTAVVMAVNPDQVPIACPRLFSSKDALIIARLLGTKAAAPIPWAQRATTNCVTFEAIPQPIDAAPKVPAPSTKISLRPKESPAAPPTRIRAERNNPYDSTTHSTPTTLACRLDWRAGRATLTTVLSMKAMLEPRIVAASTHDSEFLAHGAVKVPA